jgi:hypothetical protein
MNADIDNYLKYNLRSWATRQKPPDEVRQRLLQRAKLGSQIGENNGRQSGAIFKPESSEDNRRAAPKIQFVVKIPQPEDYCHPSEWFRLWGTFSPAYLYSVRIAIPMHFFI